MDPPKQGQPDTRKRRVVVITPTAGTTWELKYPYRDPMTGVETLETHSVCRSGIPLIPAECFTTQSAQGHTLDGVVVCAMQKGSRTNAESWWLHTYTMLSRGTALANLILFNFPPRALFEQGPPNYLRDEMHRVLQLAAQTRPLLAQARGRLGWPQRQ